MNLYLAWLIALVAFGLPAGSSILTGVYAVNVNRNATLLDGVGMRNNRPNRYLKTNLVCRATIGVKDRSLDILGGVVRGGIRAGYLAHSIGWLAKETIKRNLDGR